MERSPFCRRFKRKDGRAAENTVKRSLEFEEGLPQTTKSNREYHGFGLLSIRYTVEKYGGNLVVDARNNVFSLAIYIPLTK